MYFYVLFCHFSLKKSSKNYSKICHAKIYTVNDNWFIYCTKNTNSISMKRVSILNVRINVSKGQISV